MSVWEFIKELTNPESIIKYGGLALLLFVVFAETGLLVGFFLPGDSLLFTAGLLCGTGLFKTDIITLLVGLSLAGIVGNIFGYFFGKRVGPALFTRDDNLLFKKRYLTTTKEFYDRNGGKTLILGRFLPIIRTFAPILAGVINIDFKKFMLYNILGSIAWVLSLTLTGYYLGIKFPEIKNYLEYIIIALIVITSIPVYRTYKKEKNSNESSSK
ncbi:MAG: VTT domain-containing protein [Bacteroidetes bacterium]|nr:VTT domain-containing protein [Bacteroidota bacterium]